MSTLVVYSAAGSVSPVDGKITRNVAGTPENYTTIRNATDGTSVSDVIAEHRAALNTATTTNLYIQNVRSMQLFNTSALTADITIDSATLSLYGDGKVNQGVTPIELHACSASPAATNTLSTADYDQFGLVSFGSIDYDSWSNSGYNAIAFNATGKSAISKTGITKIGVVLNFDISGEPTWSSDASYGFAWRSADDTSGTKDPYLTIEYHIGSPVIIGGGIIGA